MANRHLLFKKDLEDFKKFLELKNYRFESPAFNSNIILKAFKAGKLEDGWCIVYNLTKGDFYSTCDLSTKEALEFYGL